MNSSLMLTRTKPSMAKKSHNSCNVALFALPIKSIDLFHANNTNFR